MREIKFRAWHKVAKQMLVVDAIDFGEKWVSHETNRITNQRHADLTPLPEIELMQFIGLRDGKEIYEGDIVECSLAISNGTLQERKKVVVQWSNTLHGFTDGRHGFIYEYSDFEVIGNIYENPELIPSNPVD